MGREGWAGFGAPEGEAEIRLEVDEARRFLPDCAKTRILPISEPLQISGKRVQHDRITPPRRADRSAETVRP